jgi:hypothetical protein
MLRKRAARLVSLFGVATMLTGFSQRATADDDDPPSRVARLAYASGSVSFQPAGTDDWVMAGLNRPVTTGDKLWSDNDGRVELQIDGSLIRLSNNTGLSFLNLGDNVTQIQVSAGTVLVRVRRLDDTETYEIDTPNLAFSVLRPGLYRITVNEAGDSTAIRIRSGEGEVTGGGAAYAVHANEDATFSGTDQLTASSGRYGNDDDQFGSWAANRDRHSQISSSAQYVSADVVGYEDLDDHGSWRQTPDNGTVWFPRTSVPGWAPYHYGHWDYIEPWGYTWVDDEPWGFAPFHYGRWVFYEGSWGWVPAPPRARGVVYVRPVYAPALVAWVGGPHFAIGLAVGGGYAPDVSVGWFPLGPREVYVPSYRVSRNYVNNVNVSNTTVTTTVVNNYYNTTVVNNNSVNVTNARYVNQRVPGAVAATTPRAFTSAQPVARNAVKLDQREVAAAPAMALTPGVAPAKQAVLGTRAAVARPPAALQTRAVVAKVAPPPPPPSFEKRQEAIKSNGGRPLSVAQMRQIDPAHREALVKIAPAANPTNRPVQPRNGPPGQVAPNTGNVAVEPPTRPADRSTVRPANPNNAAQPAQANRAAPPPAVHPSEIPIPPRPVIQPSANAELDRKHQQEQDQLRAQQVQDRQRVQQQQEQEHAKLAQQQADAARKQQVEQQHQQQTLQLQQKYAEEQKGLLEKQRQERQITPQASQTNRPVQSQNGPPAQVAPNAGNVAVERPDRPADRSTARPVNPNNVAQPAQANRPAPPPAVHPSEIPIPPRPIIQPSANAELDRKHQQEQDQLRAQQVQDRLRVQQQQEQEHTKLAQQQADAAQKQQVEQQHQQQTQHLQQQHAEEQKGLQEKQRQERQKQSKP